MFIFETEPLLRQNRGAHQTLQMYSANKSYHSLDDSVEAPKRQLRTTVQSCGFQFLKNLVTFQTVFWLHRVPLALPTSLYIRNIFIQQALWQTHRMYWVLMVSTAKQISMTVDPLSLFYSNNIPQTQNRHLMRYLSLEAQKKHYSETQK